MSPWDSIRKFEDRVNFNYGTFPTASTAMDWEEKINSIQTFGYDFPLREIVEQMSYLSYQMLGKNIRDISYWDFTDLNKEAVQLLYQNYRERKQSVSSFSNVDMSYDCRVSPQQAMCQPKVKHTCCKTCKEEHEDYYSGLITYYKLSSPKLVEQESMVCSKPACLSERLKAKLN